MTKYYVPSGKFSPSSFLYFILTAIIILPILAVIYTYLVWYIPFIYINFLITAGFGFGVGMALQYLAINIGKVRNPNLAVLFGVLGSFIAMYFSWAIWVDLVINAGESYGNTRIGITTSNIKIVQVLELAFNPSLLLDLIVDINKVGTWGLRSATISGVFLAIIWLIELLIVLVIAVLVPYASAKRPFCELSNKWFEEETLPTFNFINEVNEMIANLEEGCQTSFDELLLMPNNKSASHSVFTLFSSEKGESFLSIENKLAGTNDKGEIEFNDHEFLEYVYINSSLKNKLKMLYTEK